MTQLLPLLVLCSFILCAQSCTTFVVGRKATTDGSVMATHTNDGGGTTDPRLVRIPARDFPENSTRPIYASPENYPRYVGTERQAAAYFPENCQGGDAACQTFTPLGYIPQVAHTFAYFENTYGSINEMQVSIAESTCSGVFVSKAIGSGGNALLSIDQLSQIAMERAATAREAVQIMGDLAVEYGFYGESDSFEGGSESLIVIDPNEGWVFHILADPKGTSAIWVAARVPDNSVAVVANMFSVRDVDLSDTANYLGRADMWEIAEAEGLYTPGDAKDFTATFSDGEYSHKYYSGRRMWGVFRQLSPAADLPSEYGNLKTDAPYPFAVPVDNLATPQSIMAILRDWYNGTVYSTGDGIAAGAFGSPDRYSSNAADYTVTGSWERTIAMYRSSDSSVVQARNWLPNSIGGIIWFGPGAAHSTAYVPIPCGMLQSPDNLLWGWQGVYNTSTSYWAHRNMLNAAQIKFDFIIRDIRSTQNQLESESQKLVNEVSDKFTKQAPTNDEWVELTKEFTENSVKAMTLFNNLLPNVLFTYADGWINFWDKSGFNSVAAGYPVWWMESVGYENGPPPINSAKWSDHYRQLAFEKQSHGEKRYGTFATNDVVREGIALNAIGSHKAVDSSTSGLKSCIRGCSESSDKDFQTCSMSCVEAY